MAPERVWERGGRTEPEEGRANGRRREMMVVAGKRGRFVFVVKQSLFGFTANLVVTI